MARVSAKEMLNRLQTVELLPQTGVVAAENGADIVKKVQKQLYETGTNADGNRLRPYKRRKYAEAKHAMNPLPPFGTPDFYLTGETFREMQVQAESGRVDVVSTSIAYPFLVGRDGQKSFDMNHDNVMAFRKDTLYPELRKYIAKQTNTKLK